MTEAQFAVLASYIFGSATTDGALLPVLAHVIGGTQTVPEEFIESEDQTAPQILSPNEDLTTTHSHQPCVVGRVVSVCWVRSALEMAILCGGTIAHTTVLCWGPTL